MKNKYYFQLFCDYALKNTNTRGHVSVIIKIVKLENESEDYFFHEKIPQRTDASLMEAIKKIHSLPHLKRTDVDLKCNINKLN